MKRLSTYVVALGLLALLGLFGCGNKNDNGATPGAVGLCTAGQPGCYPPGQVCPPGLVPTPTGCVTPSGNGNFVHLQGAINVAPNMGDQIKWIIEKWLGCFGFSGTDSCSPYLPMSNRRQGWVDIVYANGQYTLTVALGLTTSGMTAANMVGYAQVFPQTNGAQLRIQPAPNWTFDVTSLNGQMDGSVSPVNGVTVVFTNAGNPFALGTTNLLKMPF